MAWLLQHGWHEKALEAVEAGTGRTELMEEVLHEMGPTLELFRRFQPN